MNLHEILVRPLITEKSTAQLHGESVFAFEVGLAAEKHQVKAAIEALYEVQVANVRTLIVRGKLKRSGRHASKRSNWKKAYVQLAAGQSLNLYDV